jgi:inosose dehydratase
MTKTVSRREFLSRFGAAASAVAVLGPNGLAVSTAAPLYPHMDLSVFDTPISAAPGDIRFGYAAITWGGDDLKAIEEIAAVGFRGIQLRSNVLERFGDRPAALRDLLAQHQLPMVAFSSGNLRLDPVVKAEELAKHTRHARFVRDVGGLYLQVIDERPKGRPIERDDYARLGRLLTDLGKQTADLGIALAYHHHMNSLGERPDEVAPILDASDPRYVKLLLDVAHYKQGGGDPVKAVRDYAERLIFLHIKDVESPVPGASGDLSRSYRFVELGRGAVDLKGVFAALADVRFRGWAIVELDRVPEPGRTPKESALMNKKYLEEQLGFVI